MKTLNDLIQSEGFQMFRADKLGNDLFISDPERAERLFTHVKEGIDGSTHYENIEDMREYLGTLKVFDPDVDDNEKDFDINEATFESMNKEIDDCIKWHEDNGSIDKICG